MIPEETIRLRSYLLWQREGYPHGKALEHWLCAEAELESEYQASCRRLGECRDTVMPRLPISRPPQRVASKRISKGARPTGTTAAPTPAVAARPSANVAKQ